MKLLMRGIHLIGLDFLAIFAIIKLALADYPSSVKPAADSVECGELWDTMIDPTGKRAKCADYQGFIFDCEKSTCWVGRAENLLNINSLWNTLNKTGCQKYTGVRPHFLPLDKASHTVSVLQYVAVHEKGYLDVEGYFDDTVYRDADYRVQQEQRKVERFRCPWAHPAHGPAVNNEKMRCNECKPAATPTLNIQLGT